VLSFGVRESDASNHFSWPRNFIKILLDFPRFRVIVKVSVKLVRDGARPASAAQPDAGKLELWGTPTQGVKVIRYWSGRVRILTSITI
jgi:hypothetical protein